MQWYLEGLCQDGNIAAHFQLLGAVGI